MSQLIDPRKLVRILITAVIFVAFGFMFFPFWKSLLMAALFGFALAKWVDRIGPQQSRRFPTILILIGFLLLVMVPILFVALRVAQSVSNLRTDKLTQMPIYQNLEHLVSKWQDSVQSMMETVHLDPSDLPQPMVLFSKAASWLVDQTTAIVGNLPDFVLGLFVFTIALYFFLTDSKGIRQFFIKLKVLEHRELDEIISIVQRSSYVTLVASTVIGAAQALTVATGSWIFGYSDFILIFIITFFVSFIPVIGAAPVALVLALLSGANGEIGSAIGLAVVAAIAGSVDNFLKPLFVSSSMETDIHPVVSLLAIVGAVIAYGIPGLFLGPILMELTLRIVPVLFKQETAGDS